VARVAEVRGAKAEEDSDGAAETALVLQEVGAVLGAHLRAGDVAAAPAHQLRRVVLLPQLGVTPRLPSVVSLKQHDSLISKVHLLVH